MTLNCDDGPRKGIKNEEHSRLVLSLFQTSKSDIFMVGVWFSGYISQLWDVQSYFVVNKAYKVYQRFSRFKKIIWLYCIYFDHQVTEKWNGIFMILPWIFREYF